MRAHGDAAAMTVMVVRAGAMGEVGTPTTAAQTSDIIQVGSAVVAFEMVLWPALQNRDSHPDRSQCRTENGKQVSLSEALIPI